MVTKGVLTKENSMKNTRKQTVKQAVAFKRHAKLTENNQRQTAIRSTCNHTEGVLVCVHVCTCVCVRVCVCVSKYKLNDVFLRL